MTNTTSAQEFDLAFSYTGNEKKGVLTPLSIPDYKEVKSRKVTSNQAAISFSITVSGTPVDKLEISIKDSKGPILKELLPSSYNVTGTHEWQWDGYDLKGVLDSKRLKASAIQVELAATKGQKTKKAVVNLKAKPAEADWVDILINQTTQKISIELRTNIKDGKAKGVGELPPQEVQDQPSYKLFSASDPRKKRHIRFKSQVDLRSMVFSGLKRYWSRSISVTNSQLYAVDLTAVHSEKQSMDDIKISYNTNNAWQRSSNPGSVRGIVSLFGNFVPERIVYNVGWLEDRGRWFYQRPVKADLSFKETSAHEIGHEILSAYGGETYSYGHKGSSTVVTQTVKTVANGGEAYPQQGDIDLMKYYDGRPSRNFFNQVIASEQDVKSLVWLARLKFND